MVGVGGRQQVEDDGGEYAIDSFWGCMYVLVDSGRKVKLFISNFILSALFGSLFVKKRPWEWRPVEVLRTGKQTDWLDSVGMTMEVC